MKKFIVVAIAFVVILVLTGTACGSTSLAGTTWSGTVALTSVTVSFVDGTQFTSDHLGNGTYSIDGNQVSLKPSGQGQTRVFVLDGAIMQGTIDGWPVTLTKQ